MAKNLNHMNDKNKMQEELSLLQQKFPDGISDVRELSEEQKAWLQLKIQSITNFDSFIVANKLQKIHNRLVHSTEDIPDKEFQEIVSFIFSNLDEIKNLASK